MEEPKSIMSELLSYKYYDTPEGTDVWKKTFVTSKYAFLTGLGIAAHDVWMYSHPKGVINKIGRIGWYLGPMVGMATAFTVTTNGLQNFRGKNDVWNYFCGGAMAGAVFGAWQRSSLQGFPVAMVLGVAAMVKKTCIDEGWTIFPDHPHMANNATSAVNMDWTMVKDWGPKHYTVDKYYFFSGGQHL